VPARPSGKVADARAAKAFFTPSPHMVSEEASRPESLPCRSDPPRKPPR